MNETQDPTAAGGREAVGDSGGGVSKGEIVVVYILAGLSIVLIRVLGTDGDHLVRSLVFTAPAAVLVLAGAHRTIGAFLHLAQGGFETEDFTGLAVFWVLPFVLFVTEVFACLTTLLLNAGIISSGEGQASVWNNERLYSWHFLNAIPALNIPETFGWEQPISLSQPWAGVLVVAFTMVLLLPLLGLVTAGYEKIQTKAVKRVSREYEFELGRASDLPLAGNLVVFFSRMMVETIVLLPAVGVAYFLVAPASPLHGSVQQGAIWRLVQIFGVLVLALMAGGGALILRIPAHFALTIGGANVLSALSVMLRWLSIFALSMLLACSVTMLLFSAGVAHTQPGTYSGDLVGVVDWYSWHLAEAIPFIDVPSAFDWTLSFEFTDAWSRSLLLALKISLVLVLFIPVMEMIALYQVIGENANERSESV